MTVLYCSVLDVKQRLSGDVPTMSAAWDGAIADAIRAVSAAFDREVARGRGEPSWSFLTDSLYAQQAVILSVGQVAPTAGTFSLSFGGQTASGIAHNASAAAVQSALQGLSSIGSGNATVSGPAGGPYLVTFAGTKTGPQANISGDATTLTPAGIVTVVTMVPGVATVPSLRYFTGRAGGARLLPIDSCVAVSAVVQYSSPGMLARTLVVGTDVLPRPLQGTPINGLWLADSGFWPTGIANNGVTAYWGGFSEIPGDVNNAAIVETTRVVLGARAGYNDNIGMSPWGTLVTAKAWTDTTKAMIRDYRDYGGGLR